MPEATTPTRPAHTPGSWGVAGSNGYPHIVGGNPPLKIADFACGRYERREDRANATLAAAAPDMLALLDEALDLVPRMSDDDPVAPALADWCRRARATIARSAS